MTVEFLEHAPMAICVSAGSAFCQLPAVWQMKIILGKYKANRGLVKVITSMGGVTQRTDVRAVAVPLACWSAFPRVKLSDDFFFFSNKL